jgi:Trk-type K+ transport system membrane component
VTITLLIAVIGWIGAVNVLVAYLLLLRRRTRADGHLYLSLNFLGSACLAVSTSVAHAWSSAAVNLIWLAIGVAPLVRAWVNVQSRRQCPGTAGDGDVR